MEEDVSHRNRHHELLMGLKCTVEGLLATNSNNVWSIYGGLDRLCFHVGKILSHRLKPHQVWTELRDHTCITSLVVYLLSSKQYLLMKENILTKFGSYFNYWMFVQGLKWLNPVLTPFIKRIDQLPCSPDDLTQGQAWLRESLNNHSLSSQLKTLVQNRQYLLLFYCDDAFLCNPEYLQALLTCLQAVELNKVALLADINLSLLSLKGSQQVCHNHSQLLRVRERRKSCADCPELTPPFSSPKRESFFATLSEQALPSRVDSNPENTKESAKNALKLVLERSSSDSLSGSPTTDFRFYDCVHSDPLIEFPPGSGNGALEILEDSQRNLICDADKSATETDGGDRILQGATMATLNGARSKTTSSTNPETRADEISARIASAGSGNANMGLAENDLHKGESNSWRPAHKRSVSDMTSSRDQTSIRHLESRNRISREGISSTHSTRPREEPVSLSAKEYSFLDLTDYPGAEFYLTRPVQGQSLLSFLSSQDFNTCANLEKENAHFSISEALIAAIEQMKWNHVISPHRHSDHEDGDSDEEIQQLKQRIRIRRRERLKEKARGFPAFSDGRTDTTPSVILSLSSSSSKPCLSDSSESSEGVDDEEIELSLTAETGENPSNLSLIRNSGLSLSMASLYSDADLQRNYPVEKQSFTSTMESCSSSQVSAESVAISLLKKFSEKQLPKASDLQWLVSEKDAPQALLPLPNSYPVSPDDGEFADLMQARTRLRGNLEWAPPRPQIVFSIHAAPKRHVILPKQNYRCAGCGAKVEPAFMKRFRHCEYLGKFFCQCCHSNATAFIPGRILKKWDFTKYCVSNFSHDLLEKIHRDPLFSVADINWSLYQKVRALDQVKNYRQQLVHLATLLNICKYGTSIYGEISKLPGHWVSDVHIYSIADLIMVKNGEMLQELKHVVNNAISHVKECLLCHCLGFICELCNNAQDIIFPFQLRQVVLCQDCKACYHRSCFVPGKCPKCARITLRRQRLQQTSLEQEDENV